MTITRFFEYDTIDSTNEEAKRLFHAGKISGVSCIIARHQSAGKGTQGRTWVSPPNAGLYFSIVHPQTLPLTPHFTLAAGVGCAELLLSELNLNVQLKPVNDLYAENKKLGGILTESLIEGGRMRALITGIGVNFRKTERVLNDARVIPVSLEELLPPHQFERMNEHHLISQLSRSVDDWYGRLRMNEQDSIMAAYKSYQMPGTVLPKLSGTAAHA